MRLPHLIRDMKAPLSGKFRTEIKKYALLLLIPVALLLILYINVDHVVTEQAEEYAELTMDHFYVQSSSMLHEMELVSNAILNSNDTSATLRAESVNSLDALYVCDIIRRGLAESPYVLHAYLICDRSDVILGDEGLFGGSSLSSLAEKIGFDAAELNGTFAAASYHLLNGKGLAPYCVFPVYDADGTALGSLIVTLRMSEFLRIFYSLDAVLCTIFNHDVYISSYLPHIDMSDFDWHSEADVGALVGQNVLCKYKDGDDYTYMVAVSRDQYTRPLHVILLWFFIYAAGVLLLGYLYLYFVSRKRYKRLSSLARGLPATYTGDSSYEHIYESVRKSLEDYRIQREHFQLEGREHALHALLVTAGERPATEKQFQEVGVEPGHLLYYVVAFFSSKPGQTDIERHHDHGMIGFIHMLFRSTIHELCEEQHIAYAYCGIPQVNIAVLYGDDADALKKAVPVISENVIEVLTNSYSISVQATISDPVSSVLELPSAYSETSRLHYFALSINSDSPVIAQERLQESSGVLLNGDFVRQEQILINTILLKKYEMVPDMVRSILSSHVSPLRKNYEMAQSRLHSVANDLAEGVWMSTVSGIDVNECAASIMQADSVQQLTDAAERVYDALAQFSRESADEAEAVAIARAYITQNLTDQNLNVSAICEAAGVSVQRLTRMFQAEFDMAIAEYVNASRIKLAKDLLADHSLTAAQIAQRVGYANADTFTRNFRKLEGITPTEYRRLHTPGA